MDVPSPRDSSKRRANGVVLRALYVSADTWWRAIVSPPVRSQSIQMLARLPRILVSSEQTKKVL